MNAAWQWLAGNPLVVTLLVMQAADIATGICVAIGRKELSSSVSHPGLTRKVVTWIVTGVCYTLQRHLPDLPLGDGAVLLYCATEGLSIVENAALLGVPLPGALVDVLDQMQRSETSKHRAKKPVEIKTNRVVVKGRDTAGEMDVMRED